MNKERKIADKVEPKQYPQYKKKEAFFQCTCGKRMVARPFKVWKDEVVNRMYGLRKRQAKKIEGDLFQIKNQIIRECPKAKKFCKAIGLIDKIRRDLEDV
jgi:hypothetical protein